MRCNATIFNDAHLCSPRYLLRCPLRCLRSCFLRCQLRCLLGWILLILRGSYKKYLKPFIEAHLEDPQKISILGFHPLDMFNNIAEYSDLVSFEILLIVLFFLLLGTGFVTAFFKCDNDHCCQFDIFRAVPYPKYSSCVFTTINNGNL